MKTGEMITESTIEGFTEENFMNVNFRNYNKKIARMPARSSVLKLINCRTFIKSFRLKHLDTAGHYVSDKISHDLKSVSGSSSVKKKIDLKSPFYHSSY